MIVTHVNAQSKPTARPPSIAPKRFAVAKTCHNRTTFSRSGTNGRRKTTASVVNVSSHSKSNASQNATRRTGNRKMRRKKKKMSLLNMWEKENNCVLCHLSFVLYLLSFVLCPLSSIFCPLSSVLCPLYLSFILCLESFSVNCVKIGNLKYIKSRVADEARKTILTISNDLTNKTVVVYSC